MMMITGGALNMSAASDSNKITRDYFDSLLLETRYIDSDLPSTEFEFFGEKFDTPIMTAALSHLHHICPNAMAEYAKGAKDANAVCFFGMGEDENLENMTATNARLVKIIKPHLDNNEVIRKIEHAVKNGAMAVGMDIDHSYSHDGGYDVVCGLPMKSKSLDELKSFVNASKVPFVVKGVLSVSDALKCVEANVSAIIVSHHHGIMPYSVPPLMVLPDIVKAVDGRMKIIVDCGIESGMDVFKSLALGADAVCVGRALMDPLKDGSKGVTDTIISMNNELKSIMARTGAHALNEIDSSVIHRMNF